MTFPEAFVTATKNLLDNEYEDFERAFGEEVPVSIRWNPLKRSAPEDSLIPWTSHGQYLKERPVFTLDPAFHAGAYYVQEASSMLLEQVLRQGTDLSEPLAVLDLSAAPGGKSTHLASLISEDSLLVSNDVIRSRASILAENLQKWGYPNVVITNNDPQDFDRLQFQFDVIVVDAPCSGEGLFRRDPEAMKEWSTDNVKLCAARQQRILADIWDALKPGGLLIYSTCTYNRLENEENLLWLSQNFEAEPAKIDIDPAWGFTKTETQGYHGFHAFPHKVKGEGFFIAAARKSDGRAKKLKKTKLRHNYASKQLAPQLASWLSPRTEQFYIQHNENILALPETWHRELIDINHSLRIVTEGLKVGAEKKNKIVPDPSLAFSTMLNPSAFQETALGKEEALTFLKKEALPVEMLKEGLNLITYDGLGLGWAKRIGHRVNNNYPTNWRIRMEIR